MKTPDIVKVKPTLRQVAANRSNAALSTGPKTSAGKAISARNSVRHGLTGTAFVVASDDLDEYNLVRSDYMCRLGPRDKMETDLVDRIVRANWILQRSWTVENSVLNLQMLRMEAPLAKEYVDLPNDARLALAFEELAKAPGLHLILRYGGHAAYDYHRALTTFMAIRKNVPLSPPGSVEDDSDETNPISIPKALAPARNTVIAIR
jgi:hypothetical protein